MLRTQILAAACLILVIAAGYGSLTISVNSARAPLIAGYGFTVPTSPTF